MQHATRRCLARQLPAVRPARLLSPMRGGAARGGALRLLRSPAAAPRAVARGSAAATEMFCQSMS